MGWLRLWARRRTHGTTRHAYCSAIGKFQMRRSTNQIQLSKSKPWLTVYGRCFSGRHREEACPNRNKSKLPWRLWTIRDHLIGFGIFSQRILLLTARRPSAASEPGLPQRSIRVMFLSSTTSKKSLKKSEEHADTFLHKVKMAIVDLLSASQSKSRSSTAIQKSPSFLPSSATSQMFFANQGFGVTVFLQSLSLTASDLNFTTT